MGGRRETTGTAAHRARQRRYRARLADERRPEADDVDRALLHELRRVAYDAGVSRDEAETAFLQSLLKGALGRLTDDGYDATASRRLVVRRLGTPPPEVLETLVTR